GRNAGALRQGILVGTALARLLDPERETIRKRSRFEAVQCLGRLGIAPTSTTGRKRIENHASPDRLHRRQAADDAAITGSGGDRERKAQLDTTGSAGLENRGAEEPHAAIRLG